MSVSSISSNNNVAQPWQTLLQRRQDFSELAQALQSGDLSGAQKAYSALQSLQQNTKTNPNTTTTGNPVQTDFAALGQALAAGNLSQAQSDFAQLKSDIQNTTQSNASGVHKHHGHHHHHTEQSDSSTSTSSDTTSGSTTDSTSQTTGSGVNLTA